MGKRETVREFSAPIILPMGTDEVGAVEQMLGFDWLLVRFAGGEKRVCHIQRKMKKRVWIRIGDVVLVSPWDFDSHKRRCFLPLHERTSKEVSATRCKHIIFFRFFSS